MLENAIEIRHLSRRFGPKKALDDVSLAVKSGTVMGLVGENGAGKTTLIKHVMGLMKPQEGMVRVLGDDPVANPVGVLSNVGYLTEEIDLPAWMKVHELIRYAQAFYPTWDIEYAESLRRSFGLELGSRLRALSKGQRARAGLLIALAYRPALIVLDEPSSGLDPIVRRDILGAIIRTIAEEGRTVLFSSHLLPEVERVSDHIAMIRRGQVVFSEAVDDVKECHRRITLRFAEPRTSAPKLDGALGWSGAGVEWTTIWTGVRDLMEVEAAGMGADLVEVSAVTLDDIFLARAGVVQAESTVESA